ncbi:MAG: MFS transporter [Victivallales bacterium]|nr:MFS transporter [Victivallales bacterium]
MDVKQKFGLSDGELGMLLLLPPAAQLAMMGVSGWLVRRFGSMRVARVAAILLPLLLPMLGTASSIWTLGCLMFLFGMATNLSNIAANTQGLQVERIYGKSIMASFHGWWSIGGTCAILFSMMMVHCGNGLQDNFIAAWVICLVIYALIFRNLLPQDSVAKTSMAHAEATRQWNAFLVLVGLVCFGALGCEGSLNNWVTPYFQSEIAPPEHLLRIGYFAYMLAATCCRFAADFLVRKWGNFKTIRFAGVMIFAGLSLIIAFPQLLITSLGCLLTGLGTAAVVPICYSIVGKYGKGSLPVALSIVNGISFIGFPLMPAVVGGIANYLGLRIAFAAMGMVCVATNCLIIPVERRSA